MVWHPALRKVREEWGTQGVWLLENFDKVLISDLVRFESGFH
jgi:hypothetical protein